MLERCTIPLPLPDVAIVHAWHEVRFAAVDPMEKAGAGARRDLSGQEPATAVAFGNTDAQ
jgi:hypothetical protein